MHSPSRESASMADDHVYSSRQNHCRYRYLLRNRPVPIRIANTAPVRVRNSRFVRDSVTANVCHMALDCSAMVPLAFPYLEAKATCARKMA